MSSVCFGLVTNKVVGQSSFRRRIFYPVQYISVHLKCMYSLKILFVSVIRYQFCFVSFIFVGWSFSFIY